MEKEISDLNSTVYFYRINDSLYKLQYKVLLKTINENNDFLKNCSNNIYKLQSDIDKLERKNKFLSSISYFSIGGLVVSSSVLFLILLK